MSKELPDIYERLFIQDGSVVGTKSDFSRLLMKGRTGVLILQPVEFISKTEFKRRHPDCKKDLECMNPKRNVASPSQDPLKPTYDVYKDNDTLPRLPVSFDTLADALKHVRVHEDREPSSIRYPGGQWHKWEEK